MSYWSSELDRITDDIKVKFTSAAGDTRHLCITPQVFEAIRKVMLDYEAPEDMEQRVIFRKFPHDGAVIALFPDQYNPRTGDIGSYMHDGQHAETAPDYGDTKPAEPGEYYALHMELIRVGYSNLKVTKRLTIKR